MDSHNPQPSEYHSEPASRQDALTASPSSARHTPTFNEPPATYQPSHMAASASAGVANPHVEPMPTPSPSAPDAPTDSWDEGRGDDQEIDDDGPVTVPVLGVQPLTRYEPYLSRDDGDAGYAGDTDDTGYTGAADVVENSATRDDAFDALDALDVDIALGFGNGNEPMLRDDAFAFRERSWDTWRRTRKSALTLLALSAMVVVAILGATMAASYMQHATRGLSIGPAQPTVSSFSGGLVIQGPEAIEPTPEAAKYQIGAWMSNNAPSGGSVKVFVRLTEDIKPLANVPITLTAQVPGGTLRYGPTKTDAYGLVTFTVQYGGLSGQPVFVTATAKVNKQTTVYADTVFVPI